MITLDPSRREEALEAGWKAYAERVPGMQAAYISAAALWDVDAVCDGDKVIGALFHKHGVIHLGIVPEYRGCWASRRLIRQMLERGTTTEIGPGDPEGFLKRIGRIAK